MENQNETTEREMLGGFAASDYAKCLEAMVQAMDVLAEKANNYEPDDFRRVGLHQISNTIYEDCIHSQLASLIGQDFVSTYLTQHNNKG